ncbi:MAG: prepilin-type N-terminal cleavage/methylation domain-containing protein [Thermodesulfobacteriota bacterium]|nr:prepilin-type N-terminal cleavage/methylation domain-containing protein [Thermodesulfobacteriota bacterium]
MVKKGFSLLEFVVVLLLIGILTIIGIHNYIALKERAKEVQVKANMHALQLVIEDFYLRCGDRYPGNLATTLIEANPSYQGPEPNTCVAAAGKPPYGANSILDNLVENPISQDRIALKDGIPNGSDHPGVIGYQASNTPGDNPSSGVPWNEAPSGPAMKYRIVGKGVNGIILVISSGD